jgi:hypothetical protein
MSERIGLREAQRLDRERERAARAERLSKTDADWAKEFREVMPPEHKPNGNGKGQGQGFDIVCLEDVKAEPVDWLWRDRLARGKLTLIGGLPGTMKSQIAIDMAARMSRGVHWPNGERAPIGRSLFICSEDDIADTILPRAEAAGADLSMVRVLRSTFTGTAGARRSACKLT